MALILQKIARGYFRPRPCPALRSLSAEFFEHQNESITGHPHEIARNQKWRSEAIPFELSGREF